MIIQDGLRRMFEDGENRFYLHHHHERELCAAGMPEGVEEGIIQGMYPLRARLDEQSTARTA